MFDLNEYLRKLTAACGTAFGSRLLYLGLQGSHMRGEASDSSDIDIMVILEGLSVDDMDVYRRILEEIGCFEKSCGFICGRDEMARWNPLEVCQLLHTTKDLVGTLADWLPEASRADEINYVRYSLGELYHELCHRYIHADAEKNRRAFRGTCKRLFFLIQNLHYLESGTFAVTKRELAEQVSDGDRAVLGMAELPDDFDFDRAFACVFRWCQHAFERVDAVR